MTRKSKEADKAYKREWYQKMKADPLAYSEHLRRAAAAAKSARAANPDKFREKSKLYYSRPGVKEASRARRAAWGATNPESVKANKRRYWHAASDEAKAKRTAAAAEKRRVWRERFPEKALREIAKDKLARSMRVARADIPNEIIEAKVAHLRLKAIIRDAKQS